MNDLARRETLRELVRHYKACQEEVRAAYGAVARCNELVDQRFESAGSYCHLEIGVRHERDCDLEDALERLKRHCWRTIYERMDVAQFMSVRRANETREQLATGKDLPDLTEENIFGMLQGMHHQIPQMFKEAVAEVFDFLTPRGWHREQWKTNQKSFAVSRKVILPYWLETYWHECWHVAYSHEPKLTALENVFRMLDGRGISKGRYGELNNAINQLPLTETTGQTEYFRFKCYRNKNLHLEFRRADLLERLNQIAAGKRFVPHVPQGDLQ